MTQPAKFDLYLRAHQMQEARRALASLEKLSAEDRQAWLSENGELLHQAMYQFIEDANQAMQNLSFDREALELSHRLVLDMRATMGTLEVVMTSGQFVNA